MESVYERLTRYRETGAALSETVPEIAALKQELARMMIGNHPQFNVLVDRYFSVDDLLGIRNRLIGSGRIGGKAAGMLAARRARAVEQFNGNRQRLDSGGDVLARLAGWHATKAATRGRQRV